jgi:hypothetical protein
MIETPKHRDTDPRPLAACGITSTCGCCQGPGTVHDAIWLGGRLWLIEWLYDHAQDCPLRNRPEPAHVLDAQALDAGDMSLPLPPTDHRCTATAKGTGQQCRNWAWRDDLCRTHHQQQRRRP